MDLEGLNDYRTALVLKSQTSHAREHTVVLGSVQQCGLVRLVRCVLFLESLERWLIRSEMLYS